MHHRSCSASDQQSQPITDTSIARNPAEIAVFWCPIAFDCDRRFRVFRSLSYGQLLRHLIVPIDAQPTPSTKDTRSHDQSFSDHDRNFDRAIQCTKHSVHLTENALCPEAPVLWESGTEKVPQRTRATKILLNCQVNFLARFASKPLLHWVVPSSCSENDLVLSVRFFGFGVLFWPLREVLLWNVLA